jgi:RHS repeat-associated protein
MKKTSTGVVSTSNYADYYPYGEQLAGRNGQLGDYRYAFQGQELDKETGMEAFQLRLWDGRIGRWLSVDPAGEFYSPYLGMGNNPIGLTDPDGGSTKSTDVIKNDDGTYTVSNKGKAKATDGDDGIYVIDKNGKRTGEIIGESLTSHSFYDDSGNAVDGAVINVNATDGQKFIDDEIIKDHPFIVNYMANATGGGDFDFKERGIDMANGTDIQHRYRGSKASNGKIGSARDFGNMAAGIVAGRFGLSWGGSRFGFDTLETFQSLSASTIPGNLSIVIHINQTREGVPTQKAQKIGWQMGIKLNKQDGKIKF